MDIEIQGDYLQYGCEIGMSLSFLESRKRRLVLLVVFISFMVGISSEK
jgi:hypothetical protein